MTLHLVLGRWPRAGKHLRAELDAGLQRASADLPGDQTLKWTRQERLTVDRATADRGEQLGYAERGLPA